MIDTTAHATTRACVFCGTEELRNFRMVFAKDLHLVAKREPMIHDVCYKLFCNIVRALEAYHEAYGAAGEACAVTCMCCHHWTFRSAHRRAKARFLPLQALRMYVATLGQGSKNSSRHICDARILHRLCETVVARSQAGRTNVYATAFTNTELETLRLVAEAPVHLAHGIFAYRWYKTRNSTLFVPTAGVAEMVREAVHTPAVVGHCEAREASTDA